MENMTIDEAATALGVSQQTLRNWESADIIKATRTPGGHRRYSQLEIIRLKTKRIAESYEGTLVQSMRNTAIEEGQKKDVDNLLDGYDSETLPYEEMNFLLYRNFDMCNQVLSEEELKQHREQYFDILKSMTAFKLVACRAMTSGIEIISYARHRSDAICLDTEEIACTTRVVNYDYYTAGYNYQEAATAIDQEIVQCLLLNARTTIEANDIRMNDDDDDDDSSKLTYVIKEVIHDIHRETSVTSENGFFWVLTPPEIRHEIKDKSLVHYKNCRLLPPNKVLVGFKSNTGFKGYSFQPFCLMATDAIDIRKSPIAYYGRRLLREGGKFYGAITVD